MPQSSGTVKTYAVCDGRVRYELGECLSSPLGYHCQKNFQKELVVPLPEEPNERLKAPIRRGEAGRYSSEIRQVKGLCTNSHRCLAMKADG